MGSEEDATVPFYVKNFKIILAVIVCFFIYLVYMGYFSKSSTKKDTTEEEEDEEEFAEDSEKFVVSGGRSDSHGGDHALLDKIHDINERQKRYVKNAGKSYKYDMREDTAAPAVYSPEDQLQKELYNM